MENFPPNNPFDPNLSFSATPIQGEAEVAPSFEEQLAARQKALAYKRTTLLLVFVCLVITAFIIWELADILAGGRPQ